MNLSTLLIIALTTLASSYAQPASKIIPAKAYYLRSESGPVALSIYADVMEDERRVHNGAALSIIKFNAGEKLTVEAKVDLKEAVRVRFLGDLEERLVSKAPFKTRYTFPENSGKSPTQHFFYAAAEDSKGNVLHVAAHSITLEWGSHPSSSSVSNVPKSVLRAAMVMKDYARIPKFIKSADELNTWGEQATPLYSAAYEGDVRLAGILLDHGAKVDYSNPAWTHPTPVLTTAIEMGHTEMAKFLVERGSRPDQLFGWDPLMMAIVRGDQASFDKLVTTKPNKNTPPPKWMSPIHLATALQKPKMVKALIERGEDMNALHGWSRSGFPPLMFAARHGSVEITKMLLAAGADPSFKTSYGASPLQSAEIEYRNLQNTTDPVQKARRDRYAEIVDLLKSAQAKRR